MTRMILLTVGLCLLAGCATTTVEGRRKERAGAYQALSADHRKLVDQGDIAAGMSEDAVYIAWGKPDQILRSGDKSGVKITWLYEGTTTDTHYYWQTFPSADANGRAILERRMVPQTEFRDYVSAELIFKGGELSSWRTLPRPGSRRYHHPGSLRY